MSEKTSKKSFSRKKKVLLVVAVILLAFIIGIVRYLTFSLPADEEAVAASMVTSDNPDKFEGIILYASYTTKKYSLANTDLKVLSLSGSNDGLATPEKIEEGKDFFTS